MKTLYLKTTMKLLRLLPVLIFFMLALSYNARSQYASPNPVCYGQPINLFCSLTGCEVTGATYTWTNVSGSWTVGPGSGPFATQSPRLYPLGSNIIGDGQAETFPGSGICNGVGYAEDRFFLQVQFQPPPGSFSGGTVKVNLLPGVFVTGVPTNILCFGFSTGSIDITPTGGRPPYTYLWSNNSTVQDPTGLAAGTYSVTVTDFVGCFNDTQFWTITSPTQLDVTGSVTPVLCSGASTGAIDISVSGGTTNYSYHWNTGAITQDLGGLVAGDYAVTVTDANGCHLSKSYTVGTSSPIVLGAVPSNVLCNGGSSGSIDLSVTGGVTAYGYLWNTGAVSQDISGLTAGVYTVVVTDGNGCTKSGSWQVIEPSAISLTGSATPVLCNGGSSGSIDITVTGGTTGYGYLWNTGAISQDINGLTAGVYTVTVSDANGCQKTDTYNVSQPLAPLALSATPANVNCNGNHNGSIDLSVTGGTTPYGYVWNTSQTTQDITGLYPGDYSVAVTDANGCSATGSWSITEPTDISWYGSVTNVSCFGGSNGHIEGGADGGTPPYTYLWSNGATTQDISNLVAGTYTVTPTDAVGCYTFTSRTIGQPTELIVDEIAVITNVSCFGGSNGAIDITVSGGTPDYGYLWSNGATTQDISGLTVGGYSVQVTDANGCQKSGFWTVTEPTVISISGTPSPVLCNGGSSGSIDISVSGGTTAYTYLWNNMAVTQDISGLTAGVYTVVVTDGNSCQKSANFTVGEPSALTLTGSASPVLCNGGSTGSINISVSGGTTDYSYMWSNFATTANISGLTYGAYTVVVTDANGCTKYNSWMVDQASPVTLSGVPSPVLCNGGSTGSIDITVAGGTTAYAYSWSNGASSEDINGLNAGVYTVTVTDGNGCLKSDMWTVTEPSALSLSGIPTPIACYGASNGSIDITVTGGTTAYTYQWSNGALTQDINGLTAGVYVVTVTDGNGCQKSDSWTITGPLAPLNATAVITNVNCNGNHNGNLDLTVTGGTSPYGYLWNNLETVEDLTGLYPGTYTVSVTDANGCGTTGSWMITEPTDISWYGSVTNVSCFGGSNGHIEGEASGGTPPYTYLWSNGATTQDISNLVAGTYTVTPTDAVGCYTFTSRIIGQPTELIIDEVAIITNVSCNGGSNGAIDITVSGGTMAYGYSWSNGASSEDISGLAAGSYTVTVTDANGCQKSGMWTVNEPTPLAITGIVSPVLCNGGSSGAIDISVSGGTTNYTYLWNTTAVTQDISGLTAGVYTVVVTDANGCQKSDSFTVTEPTALSITGTSYPVLCNGGSTGSINITVTGGTTAYSYSWSTGAGTEDISGLAAGCYTVTVMDANNCSITGSWCVTQPDALTLTGVVTPVLCNGGSNGSIDITVVGGTTAYGYSWSNGASSEDIGGLNAGVYTVTITDANGCTTSNYWQITEPSMLELSGTASPALCNGGSTGSIDITVAGGTTAYGYAWNNGAITEDISGLTAGTYTVIVTDANGCTKTDSWTVLEPSALTLQAVVTNIKCHGDYETSSIDLTVTGGTTAYSYLWSNSFTTEDITNLMEGNYTVTVTDANGCSSTGSWMVSEPSDISWFGSVTNVSCFGGSNGHIEGEASGGTPPYTYLWSNGETTQNISNLVAGTYTVTPTDASGCYTFTSRIVGEPTELIISQLALVTNVSCNGGSNGAIDITVSGGTTPYGYSWSNGASSEDISGLAAGVYTVTVTDANGCQKSDNWRVTEPSALTLTGTALPALCNGGSTGSIDITVTGGTTAYSYLWNNGATSEDINGLTAGTYTVVVTDANGCTKSDMWTVGEPSALTLTGTASPVLCNGGSSGSVDITVSGGTTAYGYLWNTGELTQDISGLTAGVYTVVVTDGNGCTITNSWQVTEPPALSLTGIVTPILCNGGSNGAINITVSGGTTAYSYSWSTGAGSEDISGLTAGCYTVTVMDANNCMITGSWCITEPTAIIITEPIIRDVTCNGADNGALFITVSGGTSPYGYIWSNGLTTEDLPCCITAGCYTVTVTDANGCQATGSWCVTEPPAITLTGVPTPVLCYGNSNGSIDITVIGGTPDYTYLWSNAETTEDITGLVAGTYTVTATDANGCPKVGSWTVTTPTELFITGISSDVLCNGGSTGAINITVTGGTTAYGYQWSNGFSTEDISDLTAGVYTVTVTDANGCPKSESWMINEPSALSLEGSVTSVTCYQGSNGAIDLTVTGGTTAYVYAWSTGASTQDISGLTVGTYTVTVTDAHLCQATKSFVVVGPPAWWVDITGHSHACCTSDIDVDYYATVGGEPGYLGNCPPCNTFEWVVIGGTITSGWNTNHITVHWNCCTQGTVTVVATLCNNCTVTSTKVVTVSLPPAPVVTGPASVTANQVGVVYTTPFVANHLYTWTVIGGTVTAGQGTNTITVTWGPFPACGCGTVTVCETETYISGCTGCPTNGCTGCDTQHITILPDPLSIQLQGYVFYKNDFNTALNGVTVKLRNTTNNTIAATTVTGPNFNSAGEPGYFSFDGVAAGSNYKLEATFNGTWGGNNATDALLVQLEAANPGTVLVPTFGLNWTAGDVNGSTSITALDALYIKLRTVGSISSYPAGNWVFESPAVTIPTVPLTNLFGLCVGDVNGSYIPTGLKDVSFLSVIDNETQTIPVEETFAYEIRSNMVAQLGAMTLFMGYDKDRFEVMDVTASSNDEMKYVIEDGNVAIAWADTKPMSVRNNDQLFTLTVKAKAPIAEATQIFNVKTGSEFASPTGTRYDNFDLKMSKVITVGGSNEFSIFNYPNPFSVSTKIVYTLPEDAKVTLVITDMYGKTVRTLVTDFQAAGNYSIAVNAAELNLASGAYLYRIEAAGATDTFVKVNKMIFAR
ncbi:MAG: T9SS type A sorting domain-containing protein [Bacteroidetes bacterium]|nr:T9SS type A sorting domain-containing protein [Bacteroidota bacterium]